MKHFSFKFLTKLISIILIISPFALSCNQQKAKTKSTKHPIRKQLTKSQRDQILDILKSSDQQTKRLFRIRKQSYKIHSYMQPEWVKQRHYLSIQSKLFCYANIILQIHRAQTTQQQELAIFSELSEHHLQATLESLELIKAKIRCELNNQEEMYSNARKKYKNICLNEFKKANPFAYHLPWYYLPPHTETLKKLITQLNIMAAARAAEKEKSLSIDGWSEESKSSGGEETP